MFGFKRKTKVKTQRNHKRRILLFYSLILGSSLFFAAGIGFVLYTDQQEPLIVSPIAGIQSHASRSVDDEQVKLIRKALQEKSISYQDIETKDSFYIVKLENGGKVTISAKKDIIVQISSLQFILSRLTMEGRQFRTLDLQFDKPIIVFKE